MNQKITKLLALAFIASAGFVQANNHYMGRGFSNNMANELVNVTKAYCDNGDAEDGWFGNFMVTGSYNGSFNNKKANGLGGMALHSKTSNEITYGMVTPVVAGGFGFDAYQFGMGSTMAGTDAKLSLSPKVYSAGADFMLYVGANKMETGFWFKAHGAVGVMAVNPTIVETGTIGTLGTYAAITGYTTMTEAFAAGKALSTNYQQMKYGKIDGKQTTGAKFGDIELALGYNFLADEDKVVGLGLRALIPTANKPKGEYIYEPIFGHGGNWGLGGEFFMKANLWSSDEDEKCLNFWLDGHVSHYFKAAQVRSFDTTLNGAGSRYMLVAEYGNETTGTRLASFNVFKDKVANLINYSTLPCNSTVSAEGAVAAMFDYNCGSWNVALGAEFWGSAKEKLAITGTLNADLVVLGRQKIGTASGDEIGGLCQPLANMASMEAMAAGTNGTGGAPSTTLLLAGAASSKLVTTDLDATSAANEARHAAKIFSNVGYKWMDSDYCPTLGVIGSAEFATSKGNAISQWGIALQGGICF
mgnify:CR=1 FL=1